MKLRNGFVSNSSSSSFLVINWDALDEKKLLSDEQEQKLIEFGFRPVMTYNAMDLECCSTALERLPDDDPWSYGFSVSCNQGDIIEWLVAHEIPFESVCHYGHLTVIFDGENVYTIPNFGLEAATYGIDALDFYFNESARPGRDLKRESIIQVRSKKDYAKTTKRILDMPSEGSRPEGD